MNTEELREILCQPESIKLDFKRHYHLNKVPPLGTDKQLWIAYTEGQWDEFIKDVIALTNGNVGTAHMVARLIIGVSDTFNPGKIRETFDASHVRLSAQQIIAKVNSVCEPPISNIVHEELDLDGKTIHIVTILPSPHVHEIKRQLKVVKGNFDAQGTFVNFTAGKTYTEYTVFVRNGENIRPASSSIRRALEADKGFELTSFNENIKFELKHNLRILLGKTKTGLIDPSVFYKNFRENVILNLDRYFEIETKYVKRLIMGAFYADVSYDNLSTQFTDHAVRSEIYLRYSISQGRYERTPFLDGLHELQINIQSFKKLSGSFDFSDFLDKYNEQCKKEGEMQVRGNDILNIAAVLSRQENIIKLSAALLCYILGNISKLAEVKLNPSSPIPQEAAKIQKEDLTEAEIMHWPLASEEAKQ